MICKNCSFDGDGKFCADCGQKLSIGRIKFKDLLHELIHTFTHFEKGYLYTLKQLALHPGTMQKEYVSGIRAKYQKPFPMFVISGTICGLALFFMYRSAPDASVQYFYRNYYVFVHTALLPIYTLFTWLLFKKSKSYYGEIFVLTIYMLGFMSLLIIPVNLLGFYLSNGVVSLIELIVLAGYNVWTFLNFFDYKTLWLTVLKTVFNIVINFMLFNEIGTLVIQLLEKH
jgi:hypothetical protein